MKIIAMILTILLLNSRCSDKSLRKPTNIDVDTSLPIGVVNLSTEKLLDLANIKGLSFNSDSIMQVESSMDLELLTDINNILQLIPIDKTLELKAKNYQTRTLKSFYIDIVPTSTSSLNPVRVDTILLNGGTISITSATATTINYSIPELINKDGIVLSGSNITNNSIELDGYTLTPTDGTKITVELTLDSISAINNDIKSNNIGLQFVMKNLEIEEATGFFGRRSLGIINQTIEIDESQKNFFENLDEVYLSNPQLTLALNYNGIDIPCGLEIKTLKFNETLLTLNKDMYVLTKDSSSFTLTNSSFVGKNEMSENINTDIKTIYISCETIINPDSDSNSKEVTNRFKAESTIIGLFTMIIPFEGRFGGMKFKHDLDLDFGSKSNSNTIYNTISYAIPLTNELPLTINLSLSVEDPNNTQEFIQLGETIIIPHAVTNTSLGSIIPSIIDEVNMEAVYLDPAQTELFMNARKLIFDLEASSSDIDSLKNIKLYKGLELNMNLIIGLKGNIKFDN